MQLGNFTKVQAYMASEIDLKKKSGVARRSARYPAITISRQTGTRGHTIGKKLINYLNKNDSNARRPWTLFDKDLIHQVLRDHDLPAQMACFMPEAKVSEIASTIEEMLGLHPSHWTMIQHTMETILKLAVMGNTVIYGRGGNLITADLKNVISVRLVGSMEKRIPQASEQYEVSLKQAKPLIIKEDQSRKQYIKRHFNKDIDDPLSYGLIINTDAFSDQAIVKAIADLALDLGR